MLSSVVVDKVERCVVSVVSEVWLFLISSFWVAVVTVQRCAKCPRWSLVLFICRVTRWPPFVICACSYRDCTRWTSCLGVSTFLTITSDFPSYVKQTMGKTEEGHAQVLASLRATGGTQVSDRVVRRCVFAPLPRLPENSDNITEHCVWDLKWH